ncbi:MAG: 50S ribosomal protein L10 [Planctomycetes bacterium]|nr:50S ribosomal protein L10 [Planctomycetota bacterium]
MTKRIKQLVTKSLRDSLEGVRDVLVVDLTGVDAVTDNQLRAKLREKAIRLMVVKNSLARQALQQAGLKTVSEQLQGPSALVWGGDGIVELAKEITAWAKQIEQLGIKGGATDGEALSAADVEALSRLPGRAELLGMVVSRILALGARLAGALSAPGGRLAGQVKTHTEAAAEPRAA